MGTNLDYIVGIGKEITPGNGVGPTRFFETEAKMDDRRTRTFGKGLRPRMATDRVSRGTITKTEVSGDFELEPTTSGFGFLLEAALGASVDLGDAFGTTGKVFQFRPTLDDQLPSYSITEVIPNIDGTVTAEGVAPYMTSKNVRRFVGCQVESLTLDIKEGEVITAKISWLGRASSSGTVIPVASYPANDELFTAVKTGVEFGGGGLSSPSASGDFRFPATALGGHGIVKDFSITIKNNLDGGGYGIGHGTHRKRALMLGKRDITGTFTVEYLTPHFEDWYIRDETKAIAVAATSGIKVGSGLGIGLALPAVKLDGEVAKSNGGSLVTQSIPFRALDDGTTGFAVEILYSTLDTAP